MSHRLVPLSLALAATLASQTPSDELRQRAREALDAAASTAGATEPGFQAPALLDIAKLLADSDPKAAMETLGVASAAAAGIPGDFVGPGLRDDIAELAVNINPKRAEEFIAPLSRNTRSLTALLNYHFGKKSYDAAYEAASRFGGLREPVILTLLLKKLPEDDERRPALYTAMLDYLRANVDSAAIAEFLKEEGKKAPLEIRAQAVSLLSRALKNPPKEGYRLEKTLSTTKGPLILQSKHEIVLFEQIPLLREFDASAAKELAALYPHVGKLLEQYPNGYDSIKADVRQESTAMHAVGEKSPANPGISNWTMEQAAKAKVVSEFADLMKNDPAAALDAALESKVDEVRFAAIGGACFKDASSIGKCERIAGGIEGKWHRMTAWNQLAEMAADKSPESAFDRIYRKSIAEVDGLFKLEIEEKIENPPPRYYWLSTQEYKRLFHAAGKAKGLPATAYLEPILDPYRQTLARMEFARAWLGQNFTFGMTMRGVPVDQR